jgi:hypothetical protein
MNPEGPLGRQQGFGRRQEANLDQLLCREVLLRTPLIVSNRRITFV